MLLSPRFCTLYYRHLRNVNFASRIVAFVYFIGKYLKFFAPKTLYFIA